MNPQWKEAKHNCSSPTTTWLPWARARSRVVTIHLDTDGSLSPATEYHDASVLHTHLQEHTYSDAPSRRSIYILEALSPEFIKLFESYFQLNPAFFEDHKRHVALYNRATGEAVGVPLLPSANYGRNFVSLKYHEPILMNPLPTGFRNLCDVSGRHVAVTKVIGKFSEVGIARRKCTLWSRENDHGGWDCLIVCDPPVERIITNYSDPKSCNVTTSPYNNGYLDFMRHFAQTEGQSGPPRTTLLDDIVYYVYDHSDKLDLATPQSQSNLVEKIIASHFLKLAEYLQMIIEVIQSVLARRQGSTGFAITAIEEQWSDVQALERRIGEYKDDVETIMLQLRIPFESPALGNTTAPGNTTNLGNTTDWKEGIADFQFLRLRFKEISERANALNGSIAALAGLTNNRQAMEAQELALKAAERSIREAKSVKALTILGIVFIPLAFVASLFSMSDPFRPGERLFWVYFVVSVPLLGLIVLGYRILELGYSDRIVH